MELQYQELAESALWKSLPPMVPVQYLGQPAPKLLKFVSAENGMPSVFIRHWIAKEESQTWKSCQELLAYAVKNAAGQLRGFFGFQLITLELYPGTSHFSPDQFTQLLVNHGRKLETGASALIRYGMFFGVLKKRIPEEWGKIELDTPVEVMNRDPKELDLELKKMIRDSGVTSGSARAYVFHDLSAKPIFRFGDEEQTRRLRKTIEKIRKEQGIFPDFYMVHQGSCVEIKHQLGDADIRDMPMMESSQEESS